MKLALILLSLLTVAGCTDNRRETPTQNIRIELVPEPDKHLREEYERLAPIRENVDRIRQIEAWTSIVRRDLGEPAEGATAIYYFLNDSLLKIVVTQPGETSRVLQEFYTKDRELSFVLERTAIGDTGHSETMEDQHFFEEGVLVRQIGNQDCGAPFTTEYLKMEQDRLKSEFGKLLHLWKGSKK